MQLNTNIYGEELWLSSFKAIYWPAQKALFIADPHFGKVEHFRKAGIALPGQAGKGNWQTLSALLRQYDVTDMYFLGDLFHSDMNEDWRNFENFLTQHPSVRFHLINGNHDIMPDFIYRQAGLTVHGEQLVLKPFLLSHHPLEKIPEGLYNLAGHIHPGVRLAGKGRQALTLPCFFFSDNQGILPAFGKFTGLYKLSPKKDDRIYVVAQGEVLQV